MFRTRFSVGDVLVILAVLLLAALLILTVLLPQNDASGEWLIVCTPEEENRYLLPVDRDITVTGNGFTLTVQIHDGRACVANADCPDKICQHTGWISRTGETVICAPASIRLTVTDREGGGSDADAIIG